MHGLPPNGAGNKLTTRHVRLAVSKTGTILPETNSKSTWNTGVGSDEALVSRRVSFSNHGFFVSMELPASIYRHRKFQGLSCPKLNEKVGSWVKSGERGCRCQPQPAHQAHCHHCHVERSTQPVELDSFSSRFQVWNVGPRGMRLPMKKWGPTVQSRNLTSIVYSKISKLKVQDLNEMFTLESQRMLFDRAFLDFVDLKHLTTRNSSIIGIPLDIPRVNMTYVRKGFRNDSGRNKAAISSMKRRNHCLNTCDSENTYYLIYKI